MKKSLWACMLYVQLAYVAAREPDQDKASQIADSASLDADFCRNGLFPREQESLSLGVVQGQKAEKVHFFDDFDGCPSNGAQCRQSTYLVPGDEVLVGKTTADWACVWYQGRKHEYVSWVPKKNVSLHPASPIHPVADWIGVWVDGPEKIWISLLNSKDGLQLRSKMRWDGGTSPDGEIRANYGGMTGRLDVHGSSASALEGDCQVRLTRIGKYLVADDNGACGGMNVRHTGLYLRPTK